MPGNAEGAAKATAARIAKAAARRAQSKQSNDTDAAVPLALVPGSFDRSAAVPSSGQAVAPLLPAALRVAGELLDGKHKASAAVRANLAIEIIKQATRPAPAGSLPAGVVQALGALAKALGVRPPVTLDAVPGEKDVTPAQP